MFICPGHVACDVSKTKQTDNGFEIYSTIGGGGSGLVQVSDPLHQTILGNLAEGSMSTTDISDVTRKAQSTLSVHLDQMVSQRLITSEYDPTDSRRKIFSISSAKMASSKDASVEGIAESKDRLGMAAKDPKNFYKNLFRAVVLTAESNGLSIGPMMEMIGSNMAEKMAPKMSTNKVEDIIRQLQDFYERNDLGEVCIYTFLPLTIIIHDPDESVLRFDSLAMFSHGLFKTLLGRTVGRDYEITRSEIFGTGNNYYKFIIELAK